jgi:cyclic pyranopterin phosphate synthase
LRPERTQIVGIQDKFQFEFPVRLQYNGVVMTLSHLDENGRAQMVDVSAKADTERTAIAKGEITMQPATLALIRAGKIEKGQVFAVARVAGILAAKRTHELIPMCHPLLITDVAVDFEILSEGNEHERARVGIIGTAKNVGKTGVEMEALVAVTTAALTIYDMAKAVDRGMHIENVRLVLKRGGKSGEIVLE